MTNNAIEIMQECFKCKHAIIWYSHRYVTCKKKVRIKPKEIFKGAVGMYLMPILFDPIWKENRCKRFKEGNNLTIKQLEHVRDLKIPWKWKEFIMQHVYLTGTWMPRRERLKLPIGGAVNSLDEIEKIARRIGIPQKEYKVKRGKYGTFGEKIKIEIIKTIYLFRKEGCSFSIINRFLGLNAPSVITSWVKIYDFNLPQEEVFKEIEEFEHIIATNRNKSNNRRGILFKNVTGKEWSKNISEEMLRIFAEFIFTLLSEAKSGINVRRKYIKERGLYISESTLHRLNGAFYNKSVEEIIKRLKEVRWTC